MHKLLPGVFPLFRVYFHFRVTFSSETASILVKAIERSELMKRRTVLPLILCMIFLAACGKRPEAATIVTASPWPSHAPGATPYVRLQSETGTMPNTETHQGPVEYSES